mgnify:CR=1 FL=1
MNFFLEGIGKVLGKVADNFQGRIERLKNEKAKLERERDEIKKLNLDITKAEDRKKAERLSDVYNRINVINGLLTTKASDWTYKRNHSLDRG